MVRWKSAAPLREEHHGTRFVTAGKEEVMRKSKDLSACISFLEDLQRRGSVDSEQRKAVGTVVDELKRIRRKPILERYEQNESIRKIVEELIRAFTKRD
jgi:hypothetical protein